MNFIFWNLIWWGFWLADSYLVFKYTTQQHKERYLEHRGMNVWLHLIIGIVLYLIFVE